MKRYETRYPRYNKVPSILGRPKKFETVEDLQKQIEEYFNDCFLEHKKENGEVILGEQIRPFTITGLAVALDTTRETLLNYENNIENATFSDTIKRAKQIIHRYAEEYLYDGKNQTGAIFNLKNNWGWVDRTEQDLTTKGKEIAPAVISAKVDAILKEDTDSKVSPEVEEILNKDDK